MILQKLLYRCGKIPVIWGKTQNVEHMHSMVTLKQQDPLRLYVCVCIEKSLKEYIARIYDIYILKEYI